MMSVRRSLVLTLRGSARSRAALQLEVLALHHQLQVLQRTRPRRLRLATADRWLWVWLSHVWTGWRTALVIVQPETVIAWHRRGFRLFWTWKSRRRTGRPTVPREVRALIRTMSAANPLWGAPRSPWQNAYVERFIGSVRRECLDHVILLNAIGLRRILHAYVEYYTTTRTHLALDKDAPRPRAVAPPPAGRVVAIPQVGGLHHRYERRAA